MAPLKGRERAKDIVLSARDAAKAAAAGDTKSARGIVKQALSGTTDPDAIAGE